MARRSTGKWVTRAAATGGGRKSRGQRPSNWYAGLAIIVIIGLGSVVLARIDYQHGASASTTPPTIGQTWHAAISFNICGTVEPALVANPVTSTTGGLTTSGSGVLVISPKTASEAGSNATLAKFVSEYPGMKLTSSMIQYPSSSIPKYVNGEKCKKGTPDAGKARTVLIRYWNPLAHPTKSKGGGTSLWASTKAGIYVSGGPSALKLANEQLITVGFVPTGTQLAKPGSQTLLALLQSLQGTSTSTTLPSGLPTTPSLPSSIPPPTFPSSASTTPSTASTTPSTASTTPSTGSSTPSVVPPKK